jgi:16S rRNA G966 N2-methylase RsmD
LQARRYPDVDMREAVTQIEGWQLAKNKLPEWAASEGVIFPPRISMEQCSSQATALYKASIAGGEKLADLTGGFGIDCSYLARNFKEAYYIERNPLLCEIAQHNFPHLGINHITIKNGECEDILPALPSLDWIFIDPARRDGDGRKVVALADCTPSVAELEETLLQKSKKVMIKCSPMLDITLACRQLTGVTAVHVVAVNNECKELLFVLGREKAAACTVHCVNILKEGVQQFSFTPEEESASSATYCSEVGLFLYEPNAAIQKAGCHNSLSQRLGLKKLHPNSQLYTADECIGDFPGRVFKVQEVLGFSKADIKRVQALGKANITVRNFPESVQVLRKRLKLADGGENYIFATTVGKGEKVLVVCKKVQ